MQRFKERLLMIGVVFTLVTSTFLAAEFTHSSPSRQLNHSLLHPLDNLGSSRVIANHMGRGRSMLYCQKFTIIHDFNNSWSYPFTNPQGSLLLSENTLYGMTSRGGRYDCGCVFGICADGRNYHVILDFSDLAPSGPRNPNASLTLVGDTLYGMTPYGGLYGRGTIFSVNKDGTGYVCLVDFGGPVSTGEYPYGSLILVENTLYGMTCEGGQYGYGCIFSIDVDGMNFRELFHFDGRNGACPYGALAYSGNLLYGMTSEGGEFGGGCVFSISLDGTLYNDLFDFNSLVGTNPYAELTIVQDTMYGVTFAGGDHDNGCIFSINKDGSMFQRVLDLCTVSANNPCSPNCALVFDNGLLYGMTSAGGHCSGGCIFSVETNGSNYKCLHDFGECALSPCFPFGSLILSQGILYGLASYGGFNNAGCVFSLVLSARPCF